MNIPIISSEWIYWLTRADVIICVCIILSIIFGIGVIGLIISICDDWCDPSGFEIALFVFFIIMFLGSLAIVIFVPDSETQIYMKIADNLTVNNINWSMDQIKSAVDYVIESIAKLK